jgi:hypothetical protein
VQDRHQDFRAVCDDVSGDDVSGRTQMKRTRSGSAFGLALLASFIGNQALAVTPATPPAGGSVKTDKARQFAGISFQLPPGFDKKDETKDSIPSPIPSAPPTTETFRSYANREKHGIYFFHWDGIPMRDRGPMQAAESWEATVDGVKAKVSLTTHFFGHAKQVLVAHFTGPAPAEHRYMIYTTVLDKAAFAALLASIRFDGRAAVKSPRP